MNWLDLTIVVCITIGLVKGLFDGFIKQAVSFMALIAAIFFAGQLAGWTRSLLRGIEFLGGLDPGILTAVCYILSFALIIIAIVFLGRIVDIAIKMTPAKFLNYLLGSLFGMLMGVVSLSILINVLEAFDVVPAQVRNQSVLYGNVREVVPTIYPIIKEYFK